MTERDGCMHCARVYIAEARRRRQTPSFHATLLRWAANMRRRAAEATEPRQQGLFGNIDAAGSGRQPGDR